MVTPRRGWGINLGYAPARGPVGLPITFDFSVATGQATYTSDLFLEVATAQIQNVQSVWVDNIDNSNKFILIFGTTGHRIVVGAGESGIFPVICGDPFEFTATSTLSGSLAVNVIFLNVPVAFGVYSQAAGGGGGGGAVTIADGADVAEGATTDAKVLGDVNGSVSAKLRGLSTILNDIWSSANHWIAVTATQTTSPWVDNITQFGGTNISTGTGASGAGIPRVTVSNDSNILATQSGNWTARIVGNAGGIFDFAGQNAAAPANAVLTGAEFNTTPTTITSGNVSPLQCDTKGNLHVTLFQQGTATPSPTGNGTSTGSIRVTLGNDSTGIVSPAASSGNGATVKTVEAAASTNATSVKASAGTVWNLNLGNSAAYDVYFKFYNKASAPTVGTDAVFYKIKVPTGARADMAFPVGLAFTTGIAYAITKLEPDTDTTVVVAGDVNGGFGWQ